MHYSTLTENIFNKGFNVNGAYITWEEKKGIK